MRQLTPKFNPFTALPGVWKSYQLVFMLSTKITNKRLAKFYAEKGIALREVWVLMGCRETVASQSVVADCLGINRNVMVRLVDSMEKKGLIRRVRNPENRREYLLKLTSKGHDALRRVDEGFDEAARTVFRPITLSELNRVKKLAVSVIKSYYENDEE